jgi:hypothetical protein
MKRRFILLAFFTLFFFAKNAFAQNGFNPVKWETSFKETGDSTGELVLKASIEPNWHTYSQVRQGNDGPLPTVFSFVKTVDFDLVKNVVEPDPIRLHSDIFDADVAMFNVEAIFTQTIKRNTKKAFEIMGQVEFMCCNDIQCLPPRVIKFTIKVPQSELK